MAVDLDILPVFLQESEGYLQTLRSTTDRELLLRAAHGLKGASAIVGLEGMIDCARRIEAALQRGEPVPAEVLGQAERRLQTLRRSGASAAQPPSSLAPLQAVPTLVDRPGAGRSLDEDWDPETARMLRALFAEEAHDHLEAIGAALMRFDESHELSAIEEMLRKAHTLKGSASTVGLPAVSEAAHSLEEELCAVRDGRAVAPQLCDRLLAALEVLRGMVAKVDTGESTAQALRRFTSALTGLEEEGSSPAGVRDSAEMGPIAASSTSEELEPLLVRQDSTELQLHDRRAGSDRRQEDHRVRVEVARLDRLMNVVGELVIDRTRVERRVEELKGLARDLSQSRQAFRSALADLGSEGGEPALARLREIDVEVADAVANLERATADLLEDSEALRRTSRSLQEILGQVRMMPIHWLHARLQRPLRGMARSQGKEVELLMADESSEMDRSIAEQVTDSLLQLIRNAVAHGIETPDARLAAGKPAIGRIRIMARHQGDFVYLEVEDDGAGIDPMQVRETLRRMGQLPAAELDSLGEAELLDHIFDSGFSTRAQVDRLAGRGVGLDVVRASISLLGGTITVSSHARLGTRFTIRIPLTTAIAQALLFKIGEPVYAIPVAYVAETLFVQQGEVRERDGKLEVLAHGTWLPLVHLHRLLGADAPIPLKRSLETAPSSARLPIVVLQFAGTRFGITCTRVIGPREIVLKRLGHVLSGLPMFAGATISGSSKVQFILDVAFLAQVALGGPWRPRPTTPSRPLPVVENGSSPQAAGARPTAAPTLDGEGVPRLLLADDSRSIREAVAQILRSAGYSVDVAADGWEAWERLQLRSYDLLITDLEMPRLHGYELIAKVRGSETLGGLPIVVLTSRTAERNREAALQKGASGFIAKPINRRVVLEQIQSLLR